MRGKNQFSGEVTKLDKTKNQVFGWAYVAEKNGQRVIDKSGEFIDPSELEDAFYKFVVESRESNDMHEGPITGTLIESFVSTPDKLEAMGLESDALPVGAWVGFQLTKDAFDLVRAGDRTMFSIEGNCNRVEIDDSIDGPQD